VLTQVQKMSKLHILFNDILVSELRRRKIYKVSREKL